MSKIRERMAMAARSSNLASREHVVMPVDCLGAMGIASRRHAIGIMAVRLKYANDASVHADMAEQLRRMIKKPLPQSLGRAIALQAMREFLMQQCKSCAGRGYKAAPNGVKHPCQSCRGSVIKRYSDTERLQSIGISLASVRTQEVIRQVDYLVGIIQAEEKFAVMRAQKCLVD